MRAWLVISAGEERQHGGNDGYDDDPARYYSWDSTVANHDSVKANDAIVLWDKRVLLGASVIEEVEVGSDTKRFYTCPVCGKAEIKVRKTRTPRYRCGSCAAEFDLPQTHEGEVTTWRSRHDVGWADLAGQMTGSELRALCVTPASQLSMRPFRWDAFVAAMSQRVPTALLTAPVHRAEQLIGGHKQATVRVRIGQPAFRRNLLEKWGSTCAITGATPEAALEACHLYSYAEVGEHHEHGGLLLRRDIHRLFDLGLLAIHPKELTVDVAAPLTAFPAYVQLSGKSLAVSANARLIQWLQAHWAEHRKASS